MSIFSMIKRGRQAAKEHKAKQVEKEKDVEKKVPYRHVPMHAATDALGVGPLAVQEADVRLKILEQNKRRSVMTASGLGMSGRTTPGMMSPFSTTRLNSSMSVVSDPVANATPTRPSIPRTHSYNPTGGPSSSESASSQEDPEVDGRVSRGESKQQEASHHRLHPSNIRKPADGQPHAAHRLSGVNRAPARMSTVVFPGIAAGIPPVPALPMELGSRKSSGASTSTAASGGSASTALSGASSSTAAEETSFHLGSDLDNTNAEGHWEPEGDWVIGTAVGTPPREATTKVAAAECSPESKDSPVRRAHSNSDASMNSLPTPDSAPVPTFPLPKKHAEQQHAEQRHAEQQYSEQGTADMEKANKEHAKPKYDKQTKTQNGSRTTAKPWMLASTTIVAGRRDAYVSDLMLEGAEKLETRKPRSRR